MNSAILITIVAVIAGLVAGGICFAVWKVLKAKKKANSEAFCKSLEECENRATKACKNCGARIPVEDQICQHCNERP